VLARGVAGIAEHAALQQARIVELADARAADNADPATAELSATGQRIRKLARALAAGKPAKITDFDTEMKPWLTHGRALAVRSLSPLADDDARREAREVLAALQGTPLADDLSSCRFL